MAWVEALPEWADTLIFGMVLWKWVAALLLFAAAFGAVAAVFRWGRRRPWDSSLRSYLRYLGAPATILVLAPILQNLSTLQINMSGHAAEAPFYLIEVARGVAIIWLIWLTLTWIAEAIIASPRVSSKSLDTHLLRLARISHGGDRKRLLSMA